MAYVEGRHIEKQYINKYDAAMRGYSQGFALGQSSAFGVGNAKAIVNTVMSWRGGQASKTDTGGDGVSKAGSDATKTNVVGGSGDWGASAGNELNKRTTSEEFVGREYLQGRASSFLSMPSSGSLGSAPVN